MAAVREPSHATEPSAGPTWNLDGGPRHAQVRTCPAAGGTRSHYRNGGCGGGCCGNVSGLQARAGWWATRTREQESTADDHEHRAQGGQPTMPHQSAIRCRRTRADPERRRPLLLRQVLSSTSAIATPQAPSTSCIEREVSGTPCWDRNRCTPSAYARLSSDHRLREDRLGLPSKGT
jgi:hypothetical protein